MTVRKYYYNLNRCISDGKTQFDTTNMPKETYEVNGQTYCGSNDLMDLLNELHEENQSMKFQLDECQNHKLFSRRKLEKENEQLKKALKELKEIGDYQAKRINELNDENEHIKHTIKTMMENERTELGKSVLKQLYEAIQ